jgi:hypothetical protein
MTPPPREVQLPLFDDLPTEITFYGGGVSCSWCGYTPRYHAKSFQKIGDLLYCSVACFNRWRATRPPAE